MTPDQRWLEAVWPFVRDQMPSTRAAVLEIGCGPLGGFVPALRREGHDAVGVDPRAPAAESYRQVAFEQTTWPQPFDVVVACTSLHHVADLDATIGRIAAALATQGTIVVIEWAWERVDEATARWCFERLGTLADPGWLSQRRDEWHASGQSWEAYLRTWAGEEGLHSSEEVRRQLDQRFACRLAADGPYFFPDLDVVAQADEQAAIDARIIRPTATMYVGQLRSQAIVDD